MIRIEAKYLLNSSSEPPIVKIELEDLLLKLTFHGVQDAFGCRGGKCDPLSQSVSIPDSVPRPKILIKFLSKLHAFIIQSKMPLLRKVMRGRPKEEWRA